MNRVVRDNLKLAVVAILVACFALSLGDALIKQQSARFVIWQIFVMRSVIAIPFLIYFVRIHSCTVPIKPIQPGWTILRSLILVLMWIFYFAALPHIELAIAAAAYYTLPIFITLFAAIFLGEKITVKGWLAVLLGFTGTLLILQPQADDFNTYALLPLVSALCYASAMILTRSKCQREKPTVLSLWLNISFVGVGAFALLLLFLGHNFQASSTTILITFSNPLNPCSLSLAFALFLILSLWSFILNSPLVTLCAMMKKHSLFF